MMRTMPKKKWTKTEIQANLICSNLWLYQGLLAVYERQTADEQNSEYSKYNNKVGFSSADSTFLTSIAKQALDRRRLSEKQVEITRKLMLKYSGQLAKIANGLI